MTVKQNEFTLTPAFGSSTFSYEVLVNDDTEFINLIPTSGARIRVNNVEVISGQPSQDITLRSGVNYAVVEVTGLQKSSGGGSLAQTTVRYIVKIIRPSDAATGGELTYLGVSKGTLSPVFRSDVKNYNVTVPYEVEDIDIVAESLKPSENLIKIDGSVQASGAARKIALAEGKSTVIRVDNYEAATAPAPSSTYTITVHRRAAVAGLTELENIKLTAYDSLRMFSLKEFSMAMAPIQ